MNHGQVTEHGQNDGNALPLPHLQVTQPAALRTQHAALSARNGLESWNPRPEIHPRSSYKSIINLWNEKIQRNNHVIIYNHVKPVFRALIVTTVANPTIHHSQIHSTWVAKGKPPKLKLGM